MARFAVVGAAGLVAMLATALGNTARAPTEAAVLVSANLTATTLRSS